MGQEKSSVIPRAAKSSQRIVRSPVEKNFREPNEVLSAYNQVGTPPSRDTKSWYRDIYEFYQKNEC